MGTEAQNVAVAFGNRPMATNSGGTTTFRALAYGMRVSEATTITAFKDENDKVIDIGWADEELAAGQEIWFGTSIKKIDVNTGGKGEYFLAETDL